MLLGIPANFLFALARVLDIVLSFYMLLIFARAVISWFSPDPYNPLYQFLLRVTEPVLMRIRRYLPVSAGMVDLSPLVALLLIIFLQSFLVQSLRGIAGALR